jgi:hypothetical protein
MSHPTPEQLAELRGALRQADRIISHHRKLGLPVAVLVAKRNMIRSALASHEPGGRVEVRRARSTGTLVGLYRNSESGMESDPDYPWSVVCEEHGCLVCVETRAGARSCMSSPHDWCPQCSGEGCGSCVGGHVAGCRLLISMTASCSGCCPNKCRGSAAMANKLDELRRAFGTRG